MYLPVGDTIRLLHHVLSVLHSISIATSPTEFRVKNFRKPLNNSDFRAARFFRYNTCKELSDESPAESRFTLARMLD